MDGFIRTVRQMSTLCGFVAAGLISAGVVVVCQMVFARFVLGSNTIWQTDFTTYSIVAATFLGSPYVLLTRGHVNVDILPHYLGQAARFRLAMLSAVMSLCFSFVMTWLAWHYWYESWSGSWVSDTMWRVRLWIPFAAMPLGFAVLTLQYIVDVYCLAVGRDLPFGIEVEHKGESA
ncbi:C4-dicarboxylate ABC transporter substrate-binding protein [Mesorhizobium sp. Root157]|uniref:TRAP transporter small permease n=1 Tax=Mesorhizobium sp. Root157 TaxID=1736477 RepID=UPI0006F25AD1|nr:TRAP transporter small permease [Mesorhizobium sp. Root157]KQZ94385.1 C4-dicarboxylate ABC transporter substrate-binding protein [Mesorhizobium sp. Root157]